MQAEWLALTFSPFVKLTLFAQSLPPPPSWVFHIFSWLSEHLQKNKIHVFFQKREMLTSRGQSSSDRVATQELKFKK